MGERKNEIIKAYLLEKETVMHCIDLADTVAREEHCSLVRRMLEELREYTDKLNTVSVEVCGIVDSAGNDYGRIVDDNFNYIRPV